MELPFNHKGNAFFSRKLRGYIIVQIVLSSCTSRVAALTVTTLYPNAIDSFPERTLPLWLEAIYYIVLLTSFTPGQYLVGDC